MLRQKAGTLGEKLKLSFFGRFASSPNLDDDPVFRTILTGSILSHRLQHFDDENGPMMATITYDGKNEVNTAAICHVFNKNSLTKNLVSGGDLSSSLTPMLQIPETVVWLHLPSLSLLKTVLKLYSLDEANIVNFFQDLSFFPRSTLVGKSGILLSLVSLCLQDESICGKKIVAYLDHSVLITFEHRIVAAKTANDMIDLDERVQIIRAASSRSSSGVGASVMFSKGGASSPMKVCFIVVG